MPRIKKATDANGTVFYPITISKGVYDTDNNQRLSTTLGWFNTGSSAYATCTSAASTVAKRASVQGADGWRLYGKIRYYSEKGDPYDPFEKGVLYKKTYKNNQRIKFRKGCTNHTIYFKMKHKKTGLIEYFTLHIDR